MRLTDRKTCALILFLLFCIYLPSQEKRKDESLRLQIGEKDHRNDIIEIFPDQIYSRRKDEAVSFLKMIKDMGDSHFIYVGETHNSLPMHDIQLKIIQAHFEQDEDLSIGLEMLPITAQEVLNEWSQGTMTQDEFVRESMWYVNWNFNFGFYEKIFEFAKENKIPLYALNVSRDIIKKIRIKGWDSLSGEEKECVPQPDLTDEEHRTLMRTIFSNTEIPQQMKGPSLDLAFEGLYRAQSAWDEVMAFRAVQSRKEKKMVVLAGSGHLLYNLGINKRAYRRTGLPFTTVISLEVPEGKESQPVSRSLGDYVWGIPEEKRPAYPSVGLGLKKFDGLKNLVIERKPIEGVAKGANFRKGDIILAVDGRGYHDINTLRIFLAQFAWDSEVRFRLLRAAREIEVVLKFKMTEEKKDKEKENKAYEPIPH